MDWFLKNEQDIHILNFYEQIKFVTFGQEIGRAEICRIICPCYIRLCWFLTLPHMYSLYTSFKIFKMISHFACFRAMVDEIP